MNKLHKSQIYPCIKVENYIIVHATLSSTFFKGTVSRDFLLPVVFMNQFPPAPEYPIRTVSNFFKNSRRMFASQGAPLMSTTPVANFALSFSSVFDTGGEFANGVKDPGGKFATSINNTAVKYANNGTNIRLQTP